MVMAVGSKIVKVPVCFLCLRNVVVDVEEIPGPEPSDSNNGDLDLLRRFLCLSLELPPAVVGDLLCSNGQVATGAGHGENLLFCGSCEKEVSATCKLYRDLSRKLRGLEGIVEKSTERVSEKLRVNLHQKVAKQLNGNSGGGGGDRVKHLRNLLTSKLHKQMGDDDDHHSDADSDDDERNMVIGTMPMMAKYSAPVVVGRSNSSGQSSDDDDDNIQKRYLQCMRCNDLFETLEDVENHLCRFRRRSLNVGPPKAKPNPKKVQKKQFGRKPKVGKALKRVKSKGSEFECGFCGKKFAYIYHLTIHERIHTGEKPFECGNCKMKFNHKGNCTKHQWRCSGKAAAKMGGTRILRRTRRNIPGAEGWIGID